MTSLLIIPSVLWAVVIYVLYGNILSRQKQVREFTLSHSLQTSGRGHLLHNLSRSPLVTFKVPSSWCIFNNCFRYFPATSLCKSSFFSKPNHSKIPLSPREELQGLQACTKLSAVLSPPLFWGIRWSVVRFSLVRQKTHSWGYDCSLSHSLMVSEILIIPFLSLKNLSVIKALSSFP